MSGGEKTYLGPVILGIGLCLIVCYMIFTNYKNGTVQGYFDNITEYLRVGPPVYFVVKDYNYRFLIL